MIVTRRSLLVRASMTAGLLAVGSQFPVAAALPAGGKVPVPPKPTYYAFKVLWKGEEIGSHLTSIVPSPNNRDMMVTTKVEMKVGIAFVTVFRFEHDSTEVWRDGRLSSLSSRTNDDGDDLRLDGEATSKGFEASGSGGPFVAASDILTTNCMWLPQLVREEKLIDAQNAVVVGLFSERLGEERMAVRGNERWAERHSILTPFVACNLWYDDEGNWVRARIEVKGETLDYNLVT